MANQLVPRVLYTVSENNLNLCVTAEPVTASAEATVYVWLCFYNYLWPSNQKYTVVSVPNVTDYFISGQ